jgi:hypothetical protein
VSRNAAATSYLVSLDDVTFFSALFTNTFIQSGSLTCYLLFF